MFLIKILLKEWKSIDWQEKKIGKRETATVTIFWPGKVTMQINSSLIWRKGIFLTVELRLL